MTATYAYDERPAGGHPLAPGASPAAIRAALLQQILEAAAARAEVVLAASSFRAVEVHDLRGVA